MFENISTNRNWPKTLVIRNTKGGMIWQIYHVENDAQAIHLASNADDNGFYGITLEDYKPYESETFPNWRMEMARSFISLLPDYLTLKEGTVDVPCEEDDYEYDDNK
jgi:hypothetical protein